jgi:LAO/AO transport system kinase
MDVDGARDPAALLRAAIAGDRRALARLLTVVESGDERFRSIAADIFAAGRGTHTVGLTGAPGAGKSSLTDALVAEIRGRDGRVAVVAVDPSSPFSGGAILGDRVRLRQAHAMHDDVFMRSLASRGQLGGLSLAVPAVVRALDAAGWPNVLIETVGVGQSEVAIAENADTTVVVVNPGWGDEVQANKAGLLEIADVLVVNKADRPGASSAVRDLERMLHLGAATAWTPVVVTTVATDGAGLERLWDVILEHQRHLAESGEGDRRRAHRRIAEVRERVRHGLDLATGTAERGDRGRELLARVDVGSMDPVSAAIGMTQLVGEAAAGG